VPEYGSLLRRLARLCRSAPARLFWQHTTLEPFFAGTDHPSERSDGVVSLRECVEVGGLPRPAVAVPIGIDAICRVYPPAGAALVVHCGVTAGSADSRVRFQVSIDGVGSEACVAGSNEWVPLRVPSISTGGTGPVLILFRTRVVAGTAANIQPVWGAPTLHWRRSLADASRMLVRAVRQYGIRGVLARIAAHGRAGALESRATYRAWLAARTPSAAALEEMRRAAQVASPCTKFAVLVIGPGDAALLRTIHSLAQQAHSAWEAWIWWPNPQKPPELEDAVGADRRLRIVADARTETDARNAMANESSADYVACVDAGDELAPSALFELATRAGGAPPVDIFYSDEDRQLPEGPGDPRFKPGWSPEYLQSRMYLGKLVAMRRRAVLAAGGYRPGMEGAHDYDVALRISAISDAVTHVPAILCHGRATERYPPAVRLAAERRALHEFCKLTGRNATVAAGMSPGIWRIRPRLEDTPQVTIVIPTDARSGPTSTGSRPLVTQCIRSIIERTAYSHYDLVIADNGRFPVDGLSLLDRVPHERVTYRWTGDFNFSRKINFAVAHARGEYVLLLNDDMEVINAEWLTAMLEYARHEKIGAVGAKLFYPDGRLQHIGVATGVCGVAAHLLHQYPAGSAGCGHIAVAARNCSAVTGACLLTRRTVYEAVGGFDDRLAIDFNDVDFCLRVRAAGYRIVFTPYAKLYHHESGSFGGRVQHPRDIQAMRDIWGSALEHDPYYNPNLSRDFPDCRLSGDSP
jgi:glycosyltransferase involved in cell wall biosynthesis